VWTAPSTAEPTAAVDRTSDRLWIRMWTTGGQLHFSVDNHLIEVAQPVDILHRCKYQM
jgi:hypothetical protein